MLMALGVPQTLGAHYLGKKVEAREIKYVMLSALIMTPQADRWSAPP